MSEGLVSFARTFAFDLTTALSVAVVLLILLVPVAAAVELARLVRAARIASLHALGMRSRGRFSVLPQYGPPSRPVVTRETHASSTKAA